MTLSTDNKYAVVGIGGIFPGASNPNQFWENILAKRVFIDAIAQDSVEREVFFRPEARSKLDKGNRSYTDLQATLDSIDFDPSKYRLPPAMASHMDANQKLSLLVADQALTTGGLEGVDSERVSVFVGNSMIGRTHHGHVNQLSIDKFEHYLRRHPDFALAIPEARQRQIFADTRSRVAPHFTGITEDTAPGVLPNIIAARINAVFDLHGHAFVIDAACASGLAAIICGIQQLRLGESDAVICGASDFQNEEYGRIYFSAIGALSSEGSFPFDERASGFVIGDGAGMVVLRRLGDAINAGNRILAVIAGYGQASDGKGKAIAAPNEIWQARAIQRAWTMAGAPADTIELIEAHGTATPVGDLSEVNALKQSFRHLGVTKSNFCGIGSVKSNIGHLKSAAGIAGFLKAVLALERKVLPPTAGFVRENPKLQLNGSPFYVVAEPRPWTRSDHPHRAGVSAFGFGGADYHIALEEYRVEDYGHSTLRRSAAVPAAMGTGSKSPVREMPRTVDGETHEQVSDLLDPLLFSGGSRAEVLRQVEAFCAAARAPNANWVDLAVAQSLSAKARDRVRIATRPKSFGDLSKQVETIRAWATAPGDEQLRATNDISWGESEPILQSQVAVMFPGQGSQYADMLSEFFERYPSARRCLLRGNAYWHKRTGRGIAELITSSRRGVPETNELLRQTQNTHPALVLSSLAMYQVLEEVGLRPRVILGHSVGEFTALAAARRLSFTGALDLVCARAEAFAQVPAGDCGAMLALPCSSAESQALMNAANAKLAIANVNSCTQTIVSGSENDVTRLAEHCATQGIRPTRLNVSHAFHSPLMKPAELKFCETLPGVEFLEGGGARVVANGSSTYYGSTSQDIRRELETQITGSVNFATSIQKLYDDGIRLFVEVGPGSVLTSLVKDVLSGTDAIALAANRKRADSVEHFDRLLCDLFAAGLDIDPTACVRERHPACDSFHLDATASDTAATVLPNPSRQRPTGQVKSPGVANLGESLTIIPPVASSTVDVVYSGVAIGLPGSFKNSFRDDNFEQLFDGHNLIERLSDAERQRLVDLHISKVAKSEQGASFATLSTLREVIQLAGKIGQLDLVGDYQIDAKDCDNMSSAIAHAVAAGYEALHDAHIPLVHEYTRTAGGSILPERWALPKEMQRHTGVIFANGFPMVDPIIREVSRHLSHQFGRKLREDLFEFYDSLLEQVSDRASRKILADWYTLNRSRIGAVPSQDDVYNFNHHLMTQIALQANNRLARLINARGPNFQINAACSSTATAVTLAEDLIRSGRAKRMLVIGADDPTSADALPYLGAGFLSTGACTNEQDLYLAALPFDRRRNGMIMGAGAVGIVVELQSECSRRSVMPVCDLLGTHVFNTAGHGSQLDVPRYAEELDNFVTRMEAQHGLDRKRIAPQLLYVSHETYTPPRGGCSESEAVALRHVFGNALGAIEISNTKGMTGHTMGASIEDAVAAKALQYGRSAPVVNHKQLDPALAGLRLSQGASGDFLYALRMAAGFGSQGNYVLLRRRADSATRIIDSAQHLKWLQSISSLDRPELNRQGRVLVVKDAKPGSIIVDRPKVDSGRPTRAAAEAVLLPPNPLPVAPRLEIDPPRDRTFSHSMQLNSPGKDSARDDAIHQRVIDIVAEVTGYPPAILELDMDLEADLGVDTVKQATILARLSDELGLSELGSLRLSDYPTLRSVVQLYVGGARIIAPQGLDAPVNPLGRDVLIANETPADNSLVFEIVAQVTGYPIDILDLSMELEADLGIDTVKQATILSLLAEKLQLSIDTDLRMSEFATVGQLVDSFAKQKSASTKAAELPFSRGSGDDSAVAKTVTTTQTTANTQSSSILAATLAGVSIEEVTNSIFEILGRISPYPRELLDAGLKLQTDLELDASAQDELRAELVGRLELGDSWVVKPDSSISEIAQSALGEMLARDDASTALALARPRTPGLIEPTIDSGVTVQTLGRQVLRLLPTPLAEGSGGALATKHIYVIGDEQHPISIISRRLKDLGAVVFELLMPASGCADDLHNELNRLMSGPRPDVIVDLASNPTETSITNLPPAAALTAINRAAECRFVLFKRLSERSGRPERVLCVTGLDGSFALGDTAGNADALFGIQLGLYKALRKEWPSTMVSILDLPPLIWQGEAIEAWHYIQRELGAPGEGVEICYLNDQRHRLVAADVSPIESATEVSFGTDEVIIATGGGSGITAQIVVELARRHNCKFVLLGRTELDPAARGKKLTSETQRSAELADIQARLQQQGLTVTPRRLASELTRIERSADIYATLDQLEQLGSMALYVKADVCDSERLQAAISRAREAFGPVTMLIHGAGLEISHLLAQKSVDEFRRVHSAKTIGAHLLGWLCRNEPLRRIVAISSISGRYGTAGQLDYSAANSFLDLLARTQSRPGLRSLSLAWSSWGELGMAWRNTFVREHAENMGLNFITPLAGARAAAREILEGEQAEVVMHRGLGTVADGSMLDTDLSGYPMIDWIERHQGRITKVHRRFSVARDAMLDQHRFAGVPLMPGVGFMEMMAESALLATAATRGAVVFRSLVFMEAFKLYRDEPRDVFVELNSSVESGGLGMTVSSNFCVKGSDRPEKRNYARAVVWITDTGPAPSFNPSSIVHSTAETTYEAELEKAKSRKHNVVFGPLFNQACASDIPDSSLIRWGAQGIEATIPLPRACLDNSRYPIDKCVLNPTFLDSLHQAGAVLAIQLTGNVYLPVSAEEFVVYDSLIQPAQYCVRARLKKLDEHRATYDMVMVREDGKLCASITDSTFQRIND